MDLRPSEADEDFRRSMRARLETLLAEHPEVRGKGAPGREHEALEARIEFERVLGKEGLIGLAWPTEVGGRDLTIAQQLIFWDEYAAAGGPHRVGLVGDWLLGPTLIEHGTAEQKQRFLPGILDGAVRWCQGYSEPDAGSDLASLRTTARREGDEWVIDGQKVWTSRADLAHWIFALCRTGAPDSRHRGISYLLIPMDQPGIEVRPIVDITGGHGDFSEVYFTGARTAADNIVGVVDGGWHVAMSTVALERGAAMVGYQLTFEHEYRATLEAARRTGASENPIMRQRLARAWTDVRILRWHMLRMLEDAGSGATVSNVYKVFWSTMHQRLGELAIDIMGPRGQVLAHGPSRGPDPLQTAYLVSRAETIYGGSNEIQRNIMGERALGLPGEPKPTRSER